MHSLLVDTHNPFLSHTSQAFKCKQKSQPCFVVPKFCFGIYFPIVYIISTINICRPSSTSKMLHHY